jgi:protein involved in polysaccharide export with SLBB domain
MIEDRCRMLLKPSQIYSLVVLIFVSSICSIVFAQDREAEKVRRPFRQSLESTELTRESPLDLDLQVQALEAAVDPDSYIVGPGDQFLVNIWSSVGKNFKIAVTPEGKLIIPTVSTLHVDGKTLSDVQKMVQEAGAKKYLQSVISANLVLLRTFRVHVTGQVKNPGPYLALAVNRVSDIIEQAGGLTTWGFERAIEVRHLDGSIDFVDLYQYEKLGNLEANIYLRGGDLIYVPSVNLSEATVRIEGTVREPGIYQLAKNETLEEFLLRVDALNRRADLKDAYIERKTDADGGLEVIPIFPYLETSGNGRSNFYLKDGDVIKVSERNEKVYVIGAVRNPGPYPYVPNLKARDYVGFAGSTELAANLSKTKVIRKNSEKQEKGQNLLIKPGDTVFVPQKVKFGVIEAFTIVGQLTSILIALKAVGAI